jgi:hypothetical protein
MSAASNGTGTYASPYNGTNTMNWSNGDEIRVRSHSIADMTEFTFTGTINQSSGGGAITNTSGSTHPPAGSILMRDSDKTCFRIGSVSGNAYSPVQTSFRDRPCFGFSTAAETFRVIRAEYHPTTNGQNRYIRPSNNTSGNTYTITDGWTSETTRVSGTDDSSDLNYLTLVANQRGDTSNNLFLYVQYLGTNSTVDLRCTSIVRSYSSSRYSRLIVTNSNNLNFKFHQSGGGYYYGGSEFQHVKDSYVQINYQGSAYYGGINLTSFPKYCTGTDIHIKNYQVEYWYSNMQGTNYDGVHVHYYKVYVNYHPNPMILYSNNSEVSLSFHDEIQVGRDSTIQGMFMNLKSVYFGPNFKHSKGHYTNYSYSNTTTIAGTGIFNKSSISTPTINMMKPAAGQVSKVTNDSNYITFGSEMSQRLMWYTSNGFYPTTRDDGNRQQVVDVEVNYDTTVGGYTSGYMPAGASTLISKWTNGVRQTGTDDTVEWHGGNNYQIDYALKITKDTSMYKTTSPSLKMYQQSYNSNYNSQAFVKSINLPVNGNNSNTFTVTGWVRSSGMSFPTDGLVARVIYNGSGNTDLKAETKINSLGTNTWKQFSVSFVPYDKQLAQFQLVINNSNSGTMWLSDLEVI